MFITHCTVADMGIVFAKTDPEKKHHGITAFLVHTDWRGVSASRVPGRLLNPLSPTGSLILDDVWVPEEYRLGAEGEGFKVAMDTLSFGRIGVPARSLGLAQRALDYALKFAATELDEEGRPLGKHQMVQKELADMVIELEAARLLVYRAAWMKDGGLPCNWESSIAKLAATEACVRIADRALRITGMAGYAEGSPLGRIYARARVSMTGEGSSNIQRILIAEHALGWRDANRHERREQTARRSEVVL